MTQEHDIAQHVVELLDFGNEPLKPEIEAGLERARLDAVEAAAHAQATPHETALAGVGRYLSEHWQHPNYAITGLLLLIILLLALMLGQRNEHAPLEADALLLASDLPPEAYVDQGFHTWLERSSQR